jgi:hypothetical protein
VRSAEGTIGTARSFALAGVNRKDIVVGADELLERPSGAVPSCAMRSIVQLAHRRLREALDAGQRRTHRVST